MRVTAGARRFGPFFSFGPNDSFVTLHGIPLVSQNQTTKNLFCVRLLFVWFSVFLQQSLADLGSPTGDLKGMWIYRGRFLPKVMIPEGDQIFLQLSLKATHGAIEHQIQAASKGRLFEFGVFILGPRAFVKMRFSSQSA